MQITKVENLKQNKKMRLLDPHLKYMLKKAQVTLDTQVEKPQYLSVAVWPMVQKVKQNIKKES